VVTQFQQDIAGIVQAWSDAFGDAQVGLLINAALQGSRALTRIPCQRF
jgi:hypothetical protein